MLLLFEKEFRIMQADIGSFPSVMTFLSDADTFLW